MNAYRIRCAASIACLLIALPALADNDNKKQQPAKRAAPQQMKQQPAQQPTLPGDGTHVNTPGGVPTGGAAGSVNTGKPMAPVGAQTVGGQQTGGAAAAGANLGATTTSSQPTSGSTLVNPNAPKTSTGGAMPGDFSRDKKLQGVVDGGAGAVKSEATAAENAAPGQSSGTDIFNKAGALPTPGGGMNAPSKTSTMSDEPAPSQASKPLGPQTEKEANHQTAVDASTKKREESLQGIHRDSKGNIITSSPSAGTGSGDGGTTLGGAWAKITRPITSDEKYKTQPSYPAGVRGTPNPDAGAGTPVPASVQNLGGKGPTLEETKKARGRQTGVPNDDKQQVDRMKADQRAASATMADRRVNTTNPGDQTTPGGGFTGSPKSGVQKSENKGGGRPGCPPDNPTC